MEITVFRQKLGIAILTVTILFIWSCAVNPVTGKREFMLLSEADEIKLGQKSDPSIVQMYGVYEDEDLQKYLNELGQKMVKVSHRSHLKFEFKLMDSPVINAFAVPGGYVYITRGIMSYMNSEAELAGVVGHEIGHVTARHSAKQYSNAQVAQLGLGLGTILAPEFAHYAGMAAQGIGLLFLRFSRDNERQSDDLGVEYATRVGYDAREMSKFFHTLDKMQSKSSQGGLPDWFSTHPNPADRVVDVKKKAEEWRTKVNRTDLKINRNEYLNRINGLIFGENPRQGFVENNVFYHPDLKFKFPFPAGWKLTNLPTQVQIVSADEKGAILFSLSSGGTISDSFNDFVKQTQAKINEQKDLKVNGFTAKRSLVTLSGQSGPLKVLSYFIQKDENIYAFHGLTKEPFFKELAAALEQPMAGFSVLANRAKLSVKPERIKIQKITKNMTLEATFKQYNVATDKMDELALVNGMDLKDKVPANTLIKILSK
jgi:predicted Zn-dependent protease